MEDPSRKRVLSDGVRVSEESKVLVVESDRETVVSGTGRKFIESGSLETNDKHDTSKNRLVGMKSRNKGWESWGVMDLVGRVLGGKLSVDEEVEDVNNSENLRGGNLVVDMNSWKGAIGKPTSENRIDIKRTMIDKDSDNLCGRNLVDDMNLWQGAITEPTSENRIAIERTTIDKDSDNLLGGNLVDDINSWQGAIGEPTSENIIDVKRTTIDKDSDNLHGENLVDDINSWQGAIGEPKSENGVDIKRTAMDKDPDKLNLGHLGQGIGLTGNQDLVFNEMVPDGKLETEEVNNISADVLIQKGRGEHYVTEKEGEYYVSDLVWGKVRSHPWWPGQIFAPSAASDKATKYLKRESYLIAYFGDQTFAWNEGSKIKPFRMHFSQMEKQSNADGFCHAMSCALDEVARRVELGLSCPCLPQEVHDKIQYQVVANAGIREESSKRAGGDNLSSAASFVPGELVQFLESLAESPQSKTEGLQFAIAKAQLLAFNRWKGHYQLPILEECGGLLEDDTQFNVKGEGEDSLKVMEGLHPVPIFEGTNDFPSRKRKSTAPGGSSCKRKHISGDEESPKIKEKYLSVLMSSSSNLQNDEQKLVRRAGRKAISSGRNSGNVNSVPSNSKVKRRKNLLSTIPSGDMVSQPKTHLKVGERISWALESGENEATRRNGGISASEGAGNSQRVEMNLADIPTPDVILSKLIVAAKNPLQGHDGMIPIVGLLRELRKSTCLEKSSFENAKIDAGKHKGKQPSILEITDGFGFEGTEDSYWTDRIIQNYSQDQVLFEPVKPNEGAVQLEANTGVVLNVDDNKERDTVVVDLESENPSVLVNEVSEEHLRTAFILNFTNLESIPSITNLNEIFSRYGPLKESETRVLSKSKRAKVIFKRRADAETAFSATGKYSIFGPSLVSYSLNYAPTPRKSSPTSKQNKTERL